MQPERSEGLRLSLSLASSGDLTGARNRRYLGGIGGGCGVLGFLGGCDDWGSAAPGAGAPFGSPAGVPGATYWPMATPFTTSSTRRFSWRPWAVEFEATGLLLPSPCAVTLFRLTPWPIR